MPKEYSFLDDPRQYRKLVNDGVLRTYNCCLCGKVLPPKTVSISDSGINHALKHHKLIPLRKYDNSRSEAVSVRYYTGWPKAYVLSREYANANNLYRPIGFSFDNTGDLTNIALKNFLCSKSCPYIESKKQALIDMQKTNIKTLFNGDETVFLYTDVGLIPRCTAKALCSTGAGASLWLASMGLSGKSAEDLRNIFNRSNYIRYLGQELYLGFEKTKLDFFISLLKAHAGPCYPDYVFLKEYV